MARVILSAALLIGLAACSGDPIDPAQISKPDELRAGGGLLTGQSGEFTRSF